MKCFISLILISVLSSCGVTNKYKTSKLPYAATKYDVDGLKNQTPVKPQNGVYNKVYNKMNKPLLAVDLPLSVVSDTVTFPYDVYKLIQKSYAGQSTSDNGAYDADVMEDGYNPATDPYLQDTEVLR